MLPLFVIIDIAIAMKYEITVAIDVYLIKLFLNKENSIVSEKSFWVKALKNIIINIAKIPCKV
nr:hypothetical protein [uncultured Romboutsia sp.]